MDYTTLCFLVVLSAGGLFGVLVAILSTLRKIAHNQQLERAEHTVRYEEQLEFQQLIAHECRYHGPFHRAYSKCTVCENNEREYEQSENAPDKSSDRCVGCGGEAQAIYKDDWVTKYRCKTCGATYKVLDS